MHVLIVVLPSLMAGRIFCHFSSSTDFVHVVPWCVSILLNGCNLSCPLVAEILLVLIAITIANTSKRNIKPNKFCKTSNTIAFLFSFFLNTCFRSSCQVNGEEIELLWQLRAQRRQSSPELPETVTRLTAPDGSILYLVGTAHFSDSSKKDVTTVSPWEFPAGFVEYTTLLTPSKMWNALNFQGDNGVINECEDVL